MDRRAAELSINVIVIAVLALVTLLILILIFKEQIGHSVRQFFSIQDKTDKCIENPNDPDCQKFLGINTNRELSPGG